MVKKLSRKDKRRLARIEKERKLNYSPLVKRARNHAVQGFLVVFLLIFLLQIYSSLNKAEPTGLVFSGVVVDVAASSVRRGQGTLAVVELENGRIIHVPFAGKKIGESLDFLEYQHRLTRRYSYHLKAIQ